MSKNQLFYTTHLFVIFFTLHFLFLFFSYFFNFFFSVFFAGTFAASALLLLLLPSLPRFLPTVLVFSSCRIVLVASHGIATLSILSRSNDSAKPTNSSILASPQSSCFCIYGVSLYLRVERREKREEKREERGEKRGREEGARRGGEKRGRDANTLIATAAIDFFPNRLPI